MIVSCNNAVYACTCRNGINMWLATTLHIIVFSAPKPCFLAHVQINAFLEHMTLAGGYIAYDAM